eukprot:scaffold58428_cov24-Tisochrysis_lutea.AAC.1
MLKLGACVSSAKPQAPMPRIGGMLGQVLCVRCARLGVPVRSVASQRADLPAHRNMQPSDAAKAWRAIVSDAICVMQPGNLVVQRMARHGNSCHSRELDTWRKDQISTPSCKSLPVWHCMRLVWQRHNCFQGMKSVATMMSPPLKLTQQTVSAAYVFQTSFLCCVYKTHQNVLVYSAMCWHHTGSQNAC